jgi:N-acetyl-gamma-glutamylphosphate reductase
MLQTINPVRSGWYKSALVFSSLALGAATLFVSAFPAMADTIIIRGNGSIRVRPSVIYDDYYHDDYSRTTILRTTRYCYPYYGVTPINERPTSGLVNCSSTGTTLRNPVIIDSTIIDSTLINPTIIDSDRVNTRTIRLR